MPSAGGPFNRHVARTKEGHAFDGALNIGAKHGR